MKNFLITGVTSGLGKYLFENIKNSTGLHRNNFSEIKNEYYDCIIHCAFNRSNVIYDHKTYLYDNIILTQNLKKIRHNKFIYISSIDVYSDNDNYYTHFKKFAETLMEPDDLIIRCSSLVGKYMKHNHLVKIKNNVETISLSDMSTFNYILYSDIFSFLLNEKLLNYKGIIDFISYDHLALSDVARLFKSNIKFGLFNYNSNHNFINPIYKIDQKYCKSSLDVLKEYYEN